MAFVIVVVFLSVLVKLVFFLFLRNITLWLGNITRQHWPLTLKTQYCSKTWRNCPALKSKARLRWQSKQRRVTKKSYKLQIALVQEQSCRQDCRARHTLSHGKMNISKAEIHFKWGFAAFKAGRRKVGTESVKTKLLVMVLAFLDKLLNPR